MTDPNDPMQQAQFDALQGMTPQQVQALVQSSYAPQRSALLTEQLAQAQAMRKHAQQAYLTPAAGALGGLSDGIKDIMANRKEDALRKQQEALLAQQQGAGGDYVSRLIAALRSGAPMPAAAPQMDVGGANYSQPVAPY